MITRKPSTKQTYHQEYQELEKYNYSKLNQEVDHE